MEFCMLFSSQYDVILTDPPWNYYGDPKKNASAGKHYDLMTDEALAAMPVSQMLSPNGVIFMWTTSSALERSINLLTEYGLAFRGVQFVWIKTRADGTSPIGARGIRPSIVKPITEFVIAASRVKRGRPMPLFDESVCQTIFSPVGRHSEKPNAVHERLEAMYPNARRLEMFARCCRPNWHAWGNEISDVTFM